MDTLNLERIEADVRHLTLTEQLWLRGRMTHLIRERTERQQQLIESRLDTMAADEDIQRELHLIEAEFAGTEGDGLDIP